MNISLLEVLLGTGLAVTTAVIGYFGAIRKAKADEAQIALEAWKNLLAPLQEELTLARKEIADLRHELTVSEQRHRQEQEKLLRKIRELKQQVEK